MSPIGVQMTSKMKPKPPEWYQKTPNSSPRLGIIFQSRFKHSSIRFLSFLDYFIDSGFHYGPMLVRIPSSFVFVNGCNFQDKQSHQSITGSPGVFSYLLQSLVKGGRPKATLACARQILESSFSSSVASSNLFH